MIFIVLSPDVFSELLAYVVILLTRIARRAR